MRLRFKSLLTFIFLLIVACIAIGVGYLFYVKVINNEAVVVADGDITINYLNGNEFSFNGDGKLEFTVTNNSNDVAYYYIQLTDVKGHINDVTYELKSTTNSLNVSSGLKSEIISNTLLIDGNKTDSYEMTFKYSGEDIYSGKIVVASKHTEDDENFSELILKNNKVSETTITNIGDKATENEGLIESTDGAGVTYYFRGNVDNNYVSFADFTWRIVRINGDGSVKLVLDNIIDVLTRYYDGSANDFEESIINTSLKNWYTTNLIDYSDYIANNKFCNDITLEGNTAIYAAYNRIIKNKIPTFVCLGAQELGKIGLLTVDEVMLAGASQETNESYYLYNKDITTDYFTMTSAKQNNGNYYPFMVKVNGAIEYNTAGNLLRGARPVINIIRNISATGDGTIDNPYILEIED